ncbi:beta family protein [Actinoplanes sp. NPDC049548]|uniref:beta family protein n=1 Tax=Actinoplanes sp. NPDC049548 TaxID=3155152 RepID=UPI0034431037
MPILKGREGELKAIAHLPETVASSIFPILEVAPATGDPIRDAYAFSAKARDSVPSNMAVAIDVDYLGDPDDGPRGPLRDIAEDFAFWGIPIRPVLHLHDSGRRLAEARETTELHSGQAVIRLGGDAADPDDEEAETKITELCRRAGTTIEQSTLVLDFFEVRSARDLLRVEPLVRKCVAWARRFPWESITVSSGAMPKTFTDLPTNTATPLIRSDLALWKRLEEPDIGFGDYGIAHPAMVVGGRAPLPSLRYTDDEVWWIYRWARDNDGNKAMYDLCSSLTEADHWPAEGAGYSWGDGEIARCAEGFGGPGNPMLWRAWGTAHHLTHVIRALGTAQGGLTR